MRPIDLQLRCYAQQESDHSWFGICIDLNLAAQGDTLAEVRLKMHKMINDYLIEALTIDEQYFDDLIPRRAPLNFILRYYWLSFITRLHKATKQTSPQLFTEHLPLVPLAHG